MALRQNYWICLRALSNPKLNECILQKDVQGILDIINTNKLYQYELNHGFVIMEPIDIEFISALHQECLEVVKQWEVFK